ncbi:hypothetical protein LguiB_019498 [Lonicera macranthoides]
MVKPGRKINSGYYPEMSPQFFKIFVPDLCLFQLRIPKAFIKCFKGVIPYKSILWGPGNRSWRVDVKKANNYFIFEKGWRKFVDDNSLKSRDFLVFAYNGNSEFHVTVFGQNNCPKQIDITALDGDNEPQPFLGRNQAVEANKSKETKGEDSAEVSIQMTVRSKRPMPVQENNGDHETPHKFESENPFFESVLKPTYAHGGFMNIPVEFMKSYMNTHGTTARLKRSNKSWVVNLIPRGRTLVFSAGWPKFVVDNVLKEGDLCRFELIRRDKYVFNVSTVRGKSKEKRGLNSREEGIKMTGDPRVQPATQENVGASEDSCKFISKHPFFQIVLARAYVHSGFLHIPADFWHIYMDKPGESATLEYSNKCWPVKLKYGSSKLHFERGWFQFVRENSLQVGNVCCFELIRRDDYAFKVSVRRGI